MSSRWVRLAPTTRAVDIRFNISDAGTLTDLYIADIPIEPVDFCFYNNTFSGMFSGGFYHFRLQLVDELSLRLAGVMLVAEAPLV